MKIIMQIFIAILTVFAHLPLIELCVWGIKMAIPMQDYLAMVILVLEAISLVGLAGGMIYVDFKGDGL